MTEGGHLGRWEWRVEVEGRWGAECVKKNEKRVESQMIVVSVLRYDCSSA